jgi:hypothetical protein
MLSTQAGAKKCRRGNAPPANACVHRAAAERPARPGKAPPPRSTPRQTPLPNPCRRPHIIPIGTGSLPLQEKRTTHAHRWAGPEQSAAKRKRDAHCARPRGRCRRSRTLCPGSEDCEQKRSVRFRCRRRPTSERPSRANQAFREMQPPRASCACETPPGRELCWNLCAV